MLPQSLIDQSLVASAASFVEMPPLIRPVKHDDLPQEVAAIACSPDGKLVATSSADFSIQLREENGRFHSFHKRHLEEFRILHKSLMPDNIAEQLTVKQLHDLFVDIAASREETGSAAADSLGRQLRAQELCQHV